MFEGKIEGQFYDGTGPDAAANHTYQLGKVRENEAKNAAIEAQARAEYEAAVAAGEYPDEAAKRILGPAQAQIAANNEAARRAVGAATTGEQLNTVANSTVFAGTTHQTNARHADGSLNYGGGHNPRNNIYGRDPAAADAAVAKAYGTGDAAADFGNRSSTAMFGAAQQYANRTAQQGDFAQQNGALGTAQGLGGRLAGLEAQQGPSAAQAQLMQGTNQAISGQLAMARSGRGFGGNAASAGLAQGNLSGILANQANASGALRAQEDAAWRGRQASNLGNAGNLELGAGQQYGQQSQANLDAFYKNQGQNDSQALAFSGLASNNYFAGANTALQGQALGNDIRNSELQAGQTNEDAMLRQWAAENNLSLGQQARQDAKDAGYLSAGASALPMVGGLISKGLDNAAASEDDESSDIRAKKDITRSDDPGLDFARAVGPELRQPDTEALDAVANAPGYSYRYRNPSAQGSAPGDQYGPMAQDLASTPAGRTAVKEGPDGKLAVDTGRLTLVNTSAISAQQRQMDELERQIAAFSAQPGASYPAPSRGSF